MKTNIVRIISVLMLATILIGTVSQPAFASASAPITDSGQASLQLSGPTDPQEMEAFMDEFIPAQLEENHIPGATVSVIKDGKLFLPKAMATQTWKRGDP